MSLGVRGTTRRSAASGASSALSAPLPSFVVGRHSEVERFHQLLAGQTPVRILNIYGPGGIGKTVVCHKLAAHASVQNVPVATVDGAQPDLTPDRILALFAEGLTVGPHARLADCFSGFDRLFNEHLTINKVLERGGGVSALFDAVGKVKDPSGLAEILAGLGKAAAEGARRVLSDRFAVERYLRGADRALVGSFSEGMACVEERSGKPPALLLDTYEEIEGLDDWICRTLVPALPGGGRLVILGRNDLHSVNFDWSDHGDAVHSLPLPELDVEDAKAYLRHYGLKDPVALDQICRFTGGYPLLLVLVRHLAKAAGGWHHIGSLEASADRDFVAGKLLERILREERVAEVRSFLERGAIARWFNPETIKVILEVDSASARGIYEKLRRHSFVERHPNGLRFHDKIRELLDARFQFTDPAEYERVRGRLITHYAEKAGLPAPTDGPNGVEQATGALPPAPTG